MAAVLLVGIPEPRRTDLITALERAGHVILEAADAPAAAER